MGADPAKWFDEVTAAIRSRDTDGVLEFLFYAYSGVWLSLTSRVPFGTNVFEKEWDVLVVLDACRVDAMRAVAPEYEFIEEVDSIWSVGSTSHEWYSQTFIRDYAEELSETALISSNPFAEHVLVNRNNPPLYPVPFLDARWGIVTEDELNYVERTRQHVCPYDEVSESLSSSTRIQPPSYITDRGIVTGRTGHERVMLHYFQPHRPFIYNLVKNDGELSSIENQPHEAARNGRAGYEELWPLYLDNLRLVLDSVEVLLDNLDAETVAITADHGELLGELGQYGHFESVPHPTLRKVPWIETTARDERTRQPPEEYSIRDQRSTEEQLENLGYL